MSAALHPVGWIDERGILFPLASYNPERASYHDAHKAGWRQVYTLARAPEGFDVLPPSAFAAARAFGAGLDDRSLEQPSEVL